jgi:hypothetical protein
MKMGNLPLSLHMGRGDAFRSVLPMCCRILSLNWRAENVTPLPWFRPTPNAGLRSQPNQYSSFSPPWRDKM